MFLTPVRLIGVLAFCLVVGAVTPGFAANLTVTVEGVHSDRGKLLFALFDQPDHWPDGDKADYNAAAPAAVGEVSVTFKDLRPGLYALGGFHDENDNGKMDTTLLGVPEEGYFLSRDARVFLSAPSFSAAAVQVGAADLHIYVHIRY